MSNHWVSKIGVGAEGLGVADALLVQKRARELAAIEGREEPDPRDWERAVRELHGREHREASGEASGATGWVSEAQGGDLRGARPEEAGTRGEEEEGMRSGVGEREGAEEPAVGEELWREGMEEAEHERMFLGSQLERESSEGEVFED
ncbi:MAG: hypothetical protein RLZZ142_2787 [Verrucomicrobiota bacterium]|jgi:hypothetical protein